MSYYNNTYPAPGTTGNWISATQQPLGVCPSCGHCPHCGRGGYQTYPYPQPYYWPYITWTSGGPYNTGTASGGNPDSVVTGFGK